MDQMPDTKNEKPQIKISANLNKLIALLWELVLSC